ncbi:MAG TPA: FxsA family protein [Hyphomicrobiaceae bacterium]|nr:FxsA family protein [Hyphomicrobiaceae bacterium]
MMLRLAIGLILIILPMLELMLLIKIGQHIGALATVALVLTTALVGAMIISRQSLSVVTRTLEAISAGRPPIEPVMDGLFLMTAGVLLLIPGLLTDVAALVLLVPPLRLAIARACMQWALRQADIRVRPYEDVADGGPARGRPEERRGSRRPAAGGDGPIIDGEFERLDERPSSDNTSNNGRGDVPRRKR